MNKTSMFLLPAAIAAVCFLSACSSFSREEPAGPPPPPEKELTAGEISKLTPEEFRAYHERRSRRGAAAEQEERDKRAKSFVDGFGGSERASREKRERLGDVSRPLNSDEQPGVFPWRSPSGERRSSKLARDLF